MCWNKFFVIRKFYFELKNFSIPENFNYGILSSILLRNKVTKTNTLSMPERN